MTISTLLRTSTRPASDAMSTIEHLVELRRRLLVCVIAFGGAAIIVYVLYGSILHILEQPYCATLHAHQVCALYVTGPFDAFAIRLNVTGYGGLVLASPVIFFQLWRFVTPGLKASERRYAIPFVIAATSLFLLGASIAWLTFPHALGFLHAVGGPGIRDIFTPDQYISLILALMAIFGLSFEFPVILVSLELAHVLTPEKLSHFRRTAIILIVVLSAVITPSSDPFSMLAMALPMLAFYEISIVIGQVAHRRSRTIS